MYEKYVKSIPDGNKKKLIAIPLLVAFFTFVLPSILQFMFIAVFPAPVDEIASFSGMLAMVTTVFVAVFLMSKLAGISYLSLGIKKEKWPFQILIGAICGVAILSIVAFIILILKASVLELNPQFSIIPFLIGLVFFIFQGTWEELIYRAYLMPHFSKVIGDKWSIIVTSVLFTLGHALNPGMQALPVVNLFIASVVFSLVYYYTGSLLIAGFGHGLWNFSQGFVFGAEVSGHSISSSVFNTYAQAGKELISGGSFGFEGGIITTIVGVVMIIVFIMLIRKERKNEK